VDHSGKAKNDGMKRVIDVMIGQTDRLTIVRYMRPEKSLKGR